MGKEKFNKRLPKIDHKKSLQMGRLSQVKRSELRF